MELPKAYNPSDFEDKIYKEWEEKGLFNPDNSVNKGKDPFSIVLPPPNVTGTLHLGHASMLAIEDLMVRYKRMSGFDTVWIPGTDHASIATQHVVEKKLLKEKKLTRHDLGRQLFLQKVDEFVGESKATIHHQVRKMGSSLDWSREAYTLDETRGRAVRKVFKKMYDDGLIYRGYRIVNWCPRCQTTLADDEIDYKEASAKLYTFKYDKNFPFAIATTRPETKVGDTAVAVNPTDERYQQYIGKTFDVDFCGVPLKIKVIAEETVEKEFGTGALGVTPAHSQVDFEMAQKNELPVIKVIDENGKMTDKAGPFAGLTVVEAREKIVAELQERGLMEKEEDLQHNLSLCYRCKTVIEPLTSEQWFIDVNKEFPVNGKDFQKLVGKKSTLKNLSLAVVREKKIEIIPDRFEKTYYHWMENLRDWCISRQLWFGHRIPVWYCADCGKNIVSDAESTEFIVVRHGEAKGNVEDKLNSDINNQLNGLTEDGKKQIESLAESLKGEKIAAIIASDFKRTTESAGILGKALDLDVNFDERLREVGVGEWEGKKDSDLAEFRINNFEAWHHESAHGIESFDSLKERVFACMEELVKKYPGQKVLIVTHGDPARIIQGFRTKMSDKEIFDMYAPKVGSMVRVFALPEKCECGSTNLVQDEDTLDTWFSSGLWTFSTLLEKDFVDFDKKNNPDLKRFHPTAVLETGYDILFFWVARMILMTTYTTGEVPFEKVYLHGLIRTKDGEKMSKSKPETAIDPLDAGAKYGFDAVRLSLLIGNTAGNDIRLYDEKIEGFRNFVNKLWNISRYILMSTTVDSGLDKDEIKWSDLSSEKNNEDITTADYWIVAKLEKTKEEVTKLLNEYNFSGAGEVLKEFTWNDFADWYLEISKVEKGKDKILFYVLRTILKLWHPFVPFVTEAIWKNFSERPLIAEAWPKMNMSLYETMPMDAFEELKEVIVKVRNLRSELKLDPVKKVNVAFKGKLVELIKGSSELVKFLARIEEMSFVDEKPDGAVGATVSGTEIYLLMSGAVDLDKEKERLAKEKANLENYIAVQEKKLGNSDFANHAPEAIVAQERAKLEEAKAKLAKIVEQQDSLK